MNPATAEAVVVASGGVSLRVEFVASDDRYRESVTIHPPAHRDSLPRRIELFRSSPVSSDPHWPANPPWQHLQWSDAEGSTRGGGPLALLVGMSGSSHWSASVAPTSLVGAGDPHEKIVLDIACRYKERPVWIGSTYELADSARVASGDNYVDILREPFGCRVRSLSTEADRTARLAVEGRRLTICPQQPDGEPPHTLRWCYSLELLRELPA